MSTTLDHPNGHLLGDLASNTSEDSDWLKTLNLRSSASSTLSKAASSGAVDEFARALVEVAKNEKTFKKSERNTLLEGLKSLRETSLGDDFSSELELALYHGDLRKSERSAHVDAFIAESSEEVAESVSLINAIWILNLYSSRLEPDTLYSLWRWTLQQGQEWMKSKPACDVEQGFGQLRYLEVCDLLAGTFHCLKGSQSLLKETTQLIRSCVEESTDNDGTPHAIWIPTLWDSISCLGRLALFSSSRDQKLLNKSFRKRLHLLIDRASCFCTVNHFSFAPRETDSSVDYSRLEAAASAFEIEKGDGVRKLFRRWMDHGGVSKGKLREWSLPEESGQSDWAMVGCLRSGWTSPVDLCVVTHDARMPQLDLVVADSTLIQGSWKHELKLNGEEVTSEAPWTCTCWFSDEEVNYMELIQEIDSTTKVARQVILLRAQQQILFNHAVYCEGANEIQYRSTLPLNQNWSGTNDTAARELLLSSDKKCVRVLPLSLPQERISKADGKISVTEQEFVVEQHAQGSGMFVSTLFDWSATRCDQPVEWGRLTVAQNGKIELPDQAAAYRFRCGRDQWLMYHSLAEPDIPRTVLGLHTPHETVLSRVTPKGEIEPIVEVEM